MIRTRCEIVYDCVIKTKEVGPIIPLTSSMLHPSLLSSGRVLLSTLSSGTSMRDDSPTEVTMSRAVSRAASYSDNGRHVAHEPIARTATSAMANNAITHGQARAVRAAATIPPLLRCCSMIETGTDTKEYA